MILKHKAQQLIPNVSVIASKYPELANVLSEIVSLISSMSRDVSDDIQLLDNTSYTSATLPAATAEFLGKGAVVTSGSDVSFRVCVFNGSSYEWKRCGSEYLFGDATNNTAFDSTGHQTMGGSAKPWNDMLIEPVARTTGSNAPTFEKWLDDSAGTSRGVYLYSFDDANAGSEKEIFFNMQMSHAWDGKSISIHIHWIGAVSDTNAAPRWGLEFAWKEPGGTYGDTTIIYSVNKIPADTGVTALKHYITDFEVQTADSTQDGLSSILIGRLFRDSANAADTYNASGAKCGLLYIDAHYQLSSLGSTDEYTK